ncbi:MAG: bifunctional riboflavin kinase/FAD synthetase [candidate division WOR-3 bacterium]|nr:bifunctional riboflavin kinase/FAD synthetase [candidate division WOR-3 bacterium]MCX7837126.1 bifunctional riboflavin kinase/FAD synthetase [candidate division WOR-3 bacterium]MDW8113665.1 bifunctional riboflavin kinase/FAD synthetase [candidate division WOR-3 bacterium]
MKIIKEKEESIKNSVITIGSFDGVHFAHQVIIEKLIISKKELKTLSGLVTFEPLPYVYFHPDFNFLLTPFEEKVKVLKNFDIDFIFVYNFDATFANLEPLEFLNKLKEDLSFKKIVIGSDFRFGRERKGDVKLLKNFCEKEGILIEVVFPIKKTGIEVKSTTIREKLILGNIRIANLLLGREYSLRGKVIQGKGRGSLIGYPTANLELLEKNKLIPQDGVYACKVAIEGEDRVYLGIVNIGERPTFGEGEKSIEVHILNFKKNILNKEIEIFFIQKIRPELRFENVEKLKERIREDIEESIKIFKRERLWEEDVKFVEKPQ